MLPVRAQVLARLKSERVWAPTHLGGEECDEYLSERSDYVTNFVHDKLRTDPIAAYFNLKETIERERAKASSGGEEYRECAIPFLKTLEEIKTLLEGTTLIRQAVKIVYKLHKVPKGREIYKTIFETPIKPSFIRTRLETKAPKGVELFDSYKVLDSDVEI